MPIDGQPRNPLAGALRWRSIGPFRGGRVHRRRRHRDAAVRLLHGRDRRRRLEDRRRGRRRGRNVSDGFFRTGSVGAGLGRRVEPEHRLRRHGRGMPARQHLVRGRRLQVDRRRQDVDACRPRRQQSDRPDANSSHQRRRRLRRGDRTSLRTKRRARRVPDEGRRQDVAEGPLRRRQDRRRGHRAGPIEPADSLRDDVAGAADAVEHHEHRPGRRPLQVDRRRRDVDEADGRLAGGQSREDRRHGVAGESAARLGDGRGRSEGRRLPIG